MTEISKRQYTLLDLVKIVDGTFKEVFAWFDFRCECEILRVQQIGKNIYLELIQYGTDGKVLAKAKGNIFNPHVSSAFLENTGLANLQQLAGSKLLFHGAFSFHQEYGFSINIDILSAEYTLGQLQKKQQDILLQLQKLGIVENNKKTHFDLPPYTLALISSATSAWRLDFLSVVEQSGYAIQTKDYYSPMHGNDAQEWVYEALKTIYSDIKEGKKIDGVVIIRGWGGSSWIIWQNDLDIAKGICYMPVPVIVAVGHTADKFVLDDIAYFSAKTPTDAAYFLVSLYEQTEKNIQQMLENIHVRTKETINNLLASIPSLYENIHIRIGAMLDTIQQNIHLRYQWISSVSPENITKHGYALVLKDGQYLSKIQADELKTGDALEIKIFDKTIHVEVKDV